MLGRCMKNIIEVALPDVPLVQASRSGLATASKLLMMGLGACGGAGFFPNPRECLTKSTVSCLNTCEAAKLHDRSLPAASISSSQTNSHTTMWVTIKYASQEALGHHAAAKSAKSAAFNFDSFAVSNKRLHFLVEMGRSSGFGLLPGQDTPFQLSVDYRNHSLIVLVDFSMPASEYRIEIWHLHSLSLERCQQASRSALHLALIDVHVDDRPSCRGGQDRSGTTSSVR
jgi:hypothetical protein